MFNLGGGEILVILLLALIVLGPEKLPDAARKVGAIMGELRRMSSGFQAELRDAMAEPEIKPGPRAVEQTETAAEVVPQPASRSDQPLTATEVVPQPASRSDQPLELSAERDDTERDDTERDEAERDEAEPDAGEPDAGAWAS